jgi:hypothetical protein
MKAPEFWDASLIKRGNKVKLPNTLDSVALRA